MKFVIPAAVLAIAATASARTVTCLDKLAWTCDGEPVTLPHTWNAQDGADGDPLNRPQGHGGDSIGVESYLRKAAKYRVRLPEIREGKRYFVRFDGVSVKADVRVNDKRVGSHQGAFTAFCREITGALDFKPGATNVLVVTADNRFDIDVPPTHADFSMQGGIYRSVWLIETDRICIDPTWYGGPGVSLSPDPDTGVVTAAIKVNGGRDETRRYPIPGHQLWSPENPKTYELEVKISQEGCEDSVKVVFGFRKAAFGEDGFFYLNGKKTIIRGINRHQDFGTKGWAIGPEDEALDARLIREMGANAVRTAHYPQSGSFYSRCDEAGLMAWCELPCVNTVSDSATYRANVEECQREMVAQLGNHPSIVFWSVYNEMYNGEAIPAGLAEPLLESANALFHRLDPSRNTVAASDKFLRTRLNAIPDALAFNMYPGWYATDPKSLGKRVDNYRAANSDRKTLCVSEYGAGGCVNHHADVLTRNEPKTHFHSEEWQAYVIAENYRSIVARNWIWGSYLWVFADFAADTRREGERDGINDKGVVTRDRAVKKDAYYFFQANWTDTPVCRIVGNRRGTWKGGKHNVMAISNTGPVALYANGRKVGETRTPDEIKTVLWTDVVLPDGDNKLELRKE